MHSSLWANCPAAVENGFENQLSRGSGFENKKKNKNPP